MRDWMSVRMCAGWACRWGLLPLLAAAVVTGAPRALLIGLSYEGSEVGNLPAIDLDLDNAEQFARDIGIEDVRRLWNRDATLQGISGALGELATGVVEEDLVLVYFSGHGTRVPDRGELDEDDDGLDEVLVPFDAVVGTASAQNVLIDDDFGQMLAAIPSRKVLVVVDACNSGTATKSIGVTPKFWAYPGYPSARPAASRKGLTLQYVPVDAGSGGANFIGIMAARDDEYANATPSGSVLTNALLEATHELKNRGHDGVSVEDLFQLVSEQVAVRMNILSGQNSGLSQHPGLFPDRAAGLRQLRLPLAAELAGDLKPPTEDPLIKRWQETVDNAKRRIEFKASRQTFAPHPDPGTESTRCNATRYAESLLAIEVVAPGDGYLNVVALPQGKSTKLVLFPNEFQPNNEVRKGQSIRIPPADTNEYCLPAMLDPGVRSESNLIVALFSAEKKDLYRESNTSSMFARTDLKLSESVGKGFPPTADGFVYDAAGTQMLLIREP